MAHYYHRYTVKGRYPFPADMLRSDGSVTQTEPDAAIVKYLSQESLPCYYRSGRQREWEVGLVHIGENRNWEPNYARWESFGWAIGSALECDLIR